MLDEGNFIYSIDRGNALGLVAGQAAQLKQKFTFQFPSPMPSFQNVVLAGMGGSAMAAELVRHWLSDKLNVPFVIVRGYELPTYVSHKSLVFISSYSGNTEETLSCYQQAVAEGIKPVVISAGGKLAELAKADGVPMLEIPQGIPQRLATLAMAKALVTALEQTDIVHGVLRELEDASDWLQQHTASWVQTVPARENLAKQFAEKLVGNSVVIYGGPTLAAIAQRWKISFNENAKNVAFYAELPEMNHNEFQGWLNPRTKPIKVIELQSSLDSDRIAKRWEVGNRLLSGNMPSPIEVMAEGETKLQQMLWAATLGDFVGVYLGILNKVDPASVDLIEKLKKEMS